ncbi:unnamed protein product [Amaranthus hypochondriacus]
MKQIILITILYLLSISLKLPIEKVECNSLYDSIPIPPLSSPSFRTTFSVPPSAYDAPAPEDSDLSYSIPPDPDSSTNVNDISLADNDSIEFPVNFNFNPFVEKKPPKEDLKTIKMADTNVKKTCEFTDNPGLCFSSLTPFLKAEKTEEKTDTYSLLEMQVKATEKATQIVIALAVKLGKEEGDKGAVKDCKEMYDDALDNLQKAVEALLTKDIGTVNTMLSAVISDFHTCDEGYKEGGNSSPLAEYGNKLSELVSNCLATVALIKGE